MGYCLGKFWQWRSYLVITGMKRRKVDINKQFFSAMITDMASVPNLVLRHYGELGLNPQECIFLLQVLAACPKGALTFCVQDVTSYLEGDELAAKNAVSALAAKGLLTPLATGDETCYTLDGIQQKMRELWAFLRSAPKASRSKLPPNPQELSADLAQVCRAFEEELGRPLSPMEGEKLSCWLFADGWHRDMVLEALKRGVIHGSCNFAYIGKILESWRKKGITNLEEALAEQKKDGIKRRDGKKGKSKNDYDALMKL